MRCRGPGFNVAACCVAIVCLLALLRSGRAFSSCTRVPVQGSILPLSQVVHIAAEDCLYDPAVEASRDGLTVVVGCSSSNEAFVLVANDVSGDYVFTDTLIPSDGTLGDWFGFHLEVTSTQVLLGSPWHDSAGPRSGAVYVFTRVNQSDPYSKWVEMQQIVPPDLAPSDEFGVNIAVDGDTAACGSLYSGVGGAAYILLQDDPLDATSTWSVTQRLQSSDIAPADGFGLVVSLSGSTLAVSAYEDDDNGDFSGSVYVFVRSNPANRTSVWVQAHKLLPSRGSANEGFGVTVALNGNVLVAAAAWATTDAVKTGYAAVFVRTNGTDVAAPWNETTILYPADTTVANQFLGAYSSFRGEVLGITTGNFFLYLYDVTQPLDADGAPDVTLREVGHMPVRSPYAGVSTTVVPIVSGTNLIDIRRTRQSLPGPALQKVLPPDGTANAQAGYSVAVTEGWAFVGSPFANDTTACCGRVRLWRATNASSPVSQWVAAQELTPATTAAGASPAWPGFGVALAVSGTTMIVGSYDSTDGSADVGQAYVFTRVAEGNWSQAAVLAPPDGSPGDQFGVTVVALDTQIGAIAVVASIAHANETGAAYVFEQPTGASQWQFSAKLVAESGLKEGSFGIDMAIQPCGDAGCCARLFVGAPDHIHNNLDLGSAYVFERSCAGGWERVQELLAPDGTIYDEFGSSVAVDGDIALVGAPLNDDLGRDSGSAYVFTRVGSEWVHSFKLLPSDGATGRQFGAHVAINGRTAVVVSNNRVHNQPVDNGAVYLFTHVRPGDPSSPWVQTGRLIPDDKSAFDGFGFSLAMWQSTIAVGAALDDDLGAASGSAYLMDLRQFEVPPGDEAWGVRSAMVSAGCFEEMQVNWPVAVPANQPVWFAPFTSVVRGLSCVLMATVGGQPCTVHVDADAPAMLHVSDGATLTLVDVNVERASSHATVWDAARQSTAPAVVVSPTERAGRLDVYGGTFTAAPVHVVGAFASCSLNRATFVRCHTLLSGGALLVTSTATADVAGCTFVGNSAETQGGAVHIGVQARATLRQCSFDLNTAGGSGGAVSVFASNQAVMEGCTLGNNTAAVSGGGLFAELPAAPVQVMDTRFDANCAVIEGGGIAISRSEMVVARSNFTTNAAGSLHCPRIASPTGVLEAGSGGAVSTAGQHTVLSLADVHMVGNMVGGDGGGVAALGGSVSVSRSVLSLNRAGASGGAVACGGGSTVSVTQCGVSDNLADVSGGGLSAKLCAVDVTGTTAFARNRVDDAGAGGGAAALTTATGSTLRLAFDQTVSWTGNTAPVGGAVLFHASIGNATCDADASACARSGLADKGARSGAVIESPLDAFVGNTATREPRGSVLAWWNSPPAGPLATGSTDQVISQPVALRFVAGRAAPRNISSRVAWSSAVELVDVYGTTVYPPGGLVQVVLSVQASNVAASVAGAVTAPFHGLSAAVDGTLLLAIPESTVTLVFSLQPSIGVLPLLHSIDVLPCGPGFAPSGDRCVACRVGEYSSDGAACLPCGEGSFSAVTQATSCEPCPRGRFLNAKGGTSADSCVACFDAATTAEAGAASQSQCVCSPNFFLEAPRQCRLCDPSAIVCPTLGTTTATVRLLPGLWRVNNRSTIFRNCPLPAMCAGSPGVGLSQRRRRRLAGANDTLDTSPSAVCAPGGGGPFCAVCNDGWHMTSGGVCEQCEPSSSATLALQASLIALAAIGVVVAVIVVRRKLAAMHEEARLEVLRDSGAVMLDRNLEAEAAKRAYALAKSRSGRLGERVGSLTSKAKIALSYVQVVSLFPLSFDLQYPDAFMELLAKFDVFNVDVFRVLSVSCAMPWMNHYTRLLFWTLLPVGVGLGLWMVNLVARGCVRRHIQQDGTPGLAAVFVSGTFPAFLVAMFTVFPSVCNAIFRTFACVTLDDGTSWMQSDLSLSCLDPAYTVFSVYAGLMAAAYCIGVPGWYLRLLWPHRQALEQGDHEDLDELAFLYDSYRPEVWWFEVFEMGRKVLLTGVAVLVLRGTMSQLAIGLLVAVLSMLVYAVWSPFDDRATNHFALASQLGLIMTLLAGVLVRARSALDDGYDEDVVGALVIVLNLVVPAIGVVVMVYKHGWLRWVATKDEGTTRERVRAFVGLPRGKPKLVEPKASSSVEMSAVKPKARRSTRVTTNPLVI